MPASTSKAFGNNSFARQSVLMIEPFETGDGDSMHIGANDSLWRDTGFQCGQTANAQCRYTSQCRLLRVAALEVSTCTESLYILFVFTCTIYWDRSICFFFYCTVQISQVCLSLRHACHAHYGCLLELSTRLATRLHHERPRIAVVAQLQREF